MEASYREEKSNIHRAQGGQYPAIDFLLAILHILSNVCNFTATFCFDAYMLCVCGRNITFPHYIQTN